MREEIHNVRGPLQPNYNAVSSVHRNKKTYHRLPKKGKKTGKHVSLYSARRCGNSIPASPANLPVLTLKPKHAKG